MADMDKEFVEYVVKALVGHPEDVKVQRSVDDMGVLLELSVNPEDMGKVIGKAGATAKSIRTLLRVLGSRNDARVNLKIVEPEGGEARVGEGAVEDPPRPHLTRNPRCLPARNVNSQTWTISTSSLSRNITAL